MNYEAAIAYARQARSHEGQLGHLARAFLHLHERAVKPRPGLTPKQQEVLEFIADHIKEKGHAPSYSEIARACGYRALSTVHEHVRTLEVKGYIVRESKASRSIRVRELAEDANSL